MSSLGTRTKCDQSCGNGVVQLGVEECDDGNEFSFDGCSSNCLNETLPSKILKFQSSNLNIASFSTVSSSIVIPSTGFNINWDLQNFYIDVDITASCVENITINLEVFPFWPSSSSTYSIYSSDCSADPCTNHFNASFSSVSQSTLCSKSKSLDKNHAFQWPGSYPPSMGTFTISVSSNIPNRKIMLNNWAIRVVATCGNGVAEHGEQCDDANNSPNDGCFNCEIEPGFCGDGTYQQGEGCDDGNVADDVNCPWNCLTPGKSWACGDGYRSSSEGCDDGNKISGDGCSSTCSVETGNHTISCYFHVICQVFLKQLFD